MHTHTHTRTKTPFLKRVLPSVSRVLRRGGWLVGCSNRRIAQYRNKNRFPSSFLRYSLACLLPFKRPIFLFVFRRNLLKHFLCFFLYSPFPLSRTPLYLCLWICTFPSFSRFLFFSFFSLFGSLFWTDGILSPLVYAFVFLSVLDYFLVYTTVFSFSAELERGSGDRKVFGKGRT